ncbi:MAG: sugar phosphate isomerase/epimerase family protein [Verrucomicrobiota bacterium]
MNRRSFLTGTATTAAALAVAPISSAVAADPPRTSRRHRLGLATYSYWHFREPRVSIETVIEKGAALGFDGIDVLHRQMDIDEKAPLDAAGRKYLRNLKRLGFLNGVEICCVSTHQSFVKPKEDELVENVEHTKKCIEIAYELGCPAIRINTGRWGTTSDFDELMKNRGIEPVLPGHTEEEGFKWCIDGITRCLPKAEECGVVLALENHWGLARTPEGLLRILNEIKSPWLGGLMDTGNFLESPYEKLKQIAAKAVYVQAKTYFGGGEWYTLDLDYKRVAKILTDVNYTGYVSLEMEGKENPDTAVPKSLAILKEAFQ